MMTSRLLLLLMFFPLLTGCFGMSSDRNKYEVIYDGEDKHEEANSQSTSKYTVAIIPKVDGIPYFNAAEEGAIEAGSDMGMNVLYQGPIMMDWKQQVELIEGFIEMGVDAIAVSAIDPEKIGPAMEKAKERGIKVFTWDSDTNPKYRQLYISMVDPEIIGRHVVDILAAQLKEKGKYAIITDSSEAANSNGWIRWMKIHQLENYPEMSLVEIIEAEDNPNKAYSAAKQLLTKYPDIKGIIGSTSVGPPAAAQAVKDLKKVGKVKVVGLSTPNLMRTFIKDGSAEMITLWSPKRLGYLTVSVMKESLDGKPITDNQRLPNVGVVKVEDDTIIMGNPIDITKENIDEYDF
ncbi:autoinducer 2 ABC transporter substrate-binding protein [Bacillus sp. 7586-K]|nr:autoinducer 2 ABC transporter substrate-binding protein [Bacillus sp. 7586-K]